MAPMTRAPMTRRTYSCTIKIERCDENNPQSRMQPGRRKVAAAGTGIHLRGHRSYRPSLPISKNKN